MSYPVHPIPPAPGQLASTAGMTPQEITAALAAGQLHWLMSGQNPAGTAPAPAPVPVTVPADGQLGDEHLAVMTPAQIADAHEQGRFQQLLTGGPSS